MMRDINFTIKPHVEQLLRHPLYREISHPDDLRCFMEHHVYAVWDFMSLLKFLQEHFTKTNSPWFPVGDPEVRYLINKLVLAYETGRNYNGQRQSQFEMYLDAMQANGASTLKIDSFLKQVTHGTDIFLVIATCDLPVSIRQFIKNTFDIISEGKPHKIAAAFTLGRTGIIPENFSEKIKEFQHRFPEDNLEQTVYFFDRLNDLRCLEEPATALVEELCGTDEQKWEEVREVSLSCLKSRMLLWNGIREELLAEHSFS
ncbi:DUF3050 domain-containing protein [Antarcticibacterium flavum]|uniref:DUF3050 domain-containing protein n=1 Tax=Antarcticibacterium flavum TaxID=2058175 RepID=A0A5B7X5H0_9FLAO|nr:MULTISPECIES: DUF3050 domain-containing protein [Antarcticibacterium]MCM4159408.1 heme oxygenase [Antarcticibacterium sp. W02-3]QCY69952.1 DUF3050 domain-containing protein [Antarcticibacterium flavum]